MTMFFYAGGVWDNSWAGWVWEDVGGELHRRHGRQWNQLWLLPAAGGDPMQLTYGEFDATAPRWSPDARRIAYICNEGGNTSLWIVDVPGGKRTRVDVRTRTYAEPVGRLVVTVVDSTTRRAMPARVSVASAATGSSTGKFFAPDGAWRHADEARVRGEQPFEYGYFHTAGTDTITVPSGRAIVEVWHGPEYRTARREVTVGTGESRTVRIPLARLSDLPSKGWWGGDLHVHMRTQFPGEQRLSERNRRVPGAPKYPGQSGWCAIRTRSGKSLAVIDGAF